MVSVGYHPRYGFIQNHVGCRKLHPTYEKLYAVWSFLHPLF